MPHTKTPTAQFDDSIREHLDLEQSHRLGDRTATIARVDAVASRERFRALHTQGCFVIPNPWDLGSAWALQRLGFPALASTSAGFAFARGLPDATDVLALEDVLAHLAELVAAVEVPVSADFQAGYADDVEGVAANVARCVQTGVAGLSIEDVPPRPDAGLLDLHEAVDRVRAARASIDSSGDDVLLTARAECFLVGHPDPLPEAIERLQAYAEAGADVLFAPGVREPDHIGAIVTAAAPKPVNVLMSAYTGLGVEDLAALGVRRISLGSTLARVAWGHFLAAARTIADEGRFTGLQGAAPFAELNALFDPGLS